MITFTSSRETVHVPPSGMKVGELAKRTGLSVRTLHYYDEIGLLQPSQVTDSRHRLYGPGELARLQQIKSLRQLGFSLDEIRACLDSPAFSPKRVLELHVKRLREQIADQQRLVALLETLSATFDGGIAASPDDFIKAIEGITMIERSFTPEELRELKERGEKLGAAHIKAVEAEWPTLIARVHAEMLAGTDPTSETMRPLAQRWRELVREFTGGNPRIEQKVRANFVENPELMRRNGLDPELFAYVNKAIRALPG
ncbi:MAG TPA: MerR family transcriptional regulator [Gemmatimonadaceae bacterium]|nr:MerR family transcriptional regulator [Gemmatimonadaceae bacterium]